MKPEAERGFLGWLDGPRLAVGAFVLFMCGMALFLLLLWSDLQNQVDRIDTIQQERSKEQQAAKQEQVDLCFATANQAPALRAVLVAIEQDGGPKTRQAVQDYRELNELNAPTLRECRQLATRLNIQIPRGIR